MPDTPDRRLVPGQPVSESTVRAYETPAHQTPYDVPDLQAFVPQLRPRVCIARVQPCNIAVFLGGQKGWRSSGRVI